VSRTFDPAVPIGKRRNRTYPVDWRDNEDGFAGHTIEGGESRPDALNPAPP
jgi:hypothetical protein